MKKENMFLRVTTLCFKIATITAMLFITASNPAFATSAAGGNGPIFNSLSVFNEGFSYLAPNTIKLTWETDKPATSRVMYGGQSRKVMFLDIDDVNYGYDFSTDQDNTLVTKHEMVITNLSCSDTQYFFRPESRVNNFARFGNEKTIKQSSASVTGAGNHSESCNYISNYLRINDDNNIDDVKKLQTFLRDYEGFINLKITGVFDQATFDAVSSFQLKYADDVLAPWGIDSPTGYVYYTTQNKINEIYCGNKISLTENQLEEINKTKALLENTKSNGQYPNIDFETIGDEGSGDDDYIDSDRGSMKASVGEVKGSFIQSIFFKVRGWFR